MTTLFDYLSWRGDLPLSADPFHEVDGVILARFTYMPFHRVLRRDSLTPTTVEAVCRALLALPDIETAVRRRGDTDLLRALVESPRYKGMELTAYADRLDAESQTQFSAITVKLEEDHYCVAYRGTDNTLIGWKEDFNLSYKQVIPSQRSALAYVSGVSSATTCQLILGGHSKGGNLAQYAALCTDEGTYRRIIAIYDHDGPSFLEDPSPRRTTAEYDRKLHKLVPESSAFGMILERRDDYRVVQSSASAIFQHHPFSWMVEGDDFVYQQDLNASAQFFDEALDTWLRSKTPAERERFIQTIYDLIMQTNATSWADFQTRLGANMATVMGAGSKLDTDTKQFLISTLGSLGATLKNQTIARIKDAGTGLLQNESRKRNNQ